MSCAGEPRNPHEGPIAALNNSFWLRGTQRVPRGPKSVDQCIAPTLAAKTAHRTPTDDPRSPRAAARRHARSSRASLGASAFHARGSDSGRHGRRHWHHRRRARAPRSATDATIKGGALGKSGCEVVRSPVVRPRAGRRRGIPVMGLWHSGGARLREGVASLDARRTPSSRDDPGLGQGAADLRGARSVRRWRGLRPGAHRRGHPRTREAGCSSPAPTSSARSPAESVDVIRLGGPEPHGRRSGVVHVVADSEQTCVWSGTPLVALLGDQRDRRRRRGPRDTPRRPARLTSGLMTSIPIVARLLDDRASLELHPGWAPNVTATLGRIGGRTVGVLANNPRCGWVDVSTRRRPRRRRDSSGCVTRSACHSPCWSTCLDICLASTRSGTGWCGAARSCCMPSVRRWCARDRRHAKGLRQGPTSR